MCELTGARIIGIAEAHGTGQALDLRLASREKVPPGCAFRVAPQILVPFSLGELGRFSRIDTDADDLEIAARFERHPTQTANQTVQYLRAQHGALVIDQRQDHRLAAEELRQRRLVAVLITEFEIERSLRVDRKSTR